MNCITPTFTLLPSLTSAGNIELHSHNNDHITLLLSVIPCEINVPANIIVTNILVVPLQISHVNKQLDTSNVGSP